MKGTKGGSLKKYVALIFFLPTLASGQLKNFYQVTPLDGSIPRTLLFRGGEPTAVGLQNLPGFGIRTLLNLESTDAQFQRERAAGDSLGIAVFQIKISPLFLKPSQAKLNRMISFLSDRSHYPLYIHCRNGEDRTGLAIALYRVFVEGVGPAIAYQEMLQYGFHPIAQAGLKCAFWERTGLPVPAYCGAIPLDP